jgi:hypothetical protein
MLMKDSHVEESTVYKQLVHDGHRKIVPMKSSVQEFTKKICQQGFKQQAIIISQNHNHHILRC